MDWLKIGRAALFFSLALVTGLFFGSQMLKAHSPYTADNEKSFVPDGFFKTISSVFDQNFKPKDFTPEQTVFLSERGVLETIVKMPQKGKPFCYLCFNGLYLMDADGRILASADSSGQLDLPVISGPCFQMLVEGRRLVGDGFFEAMSFLHEAKKYPMLYPQLSEIYVDSGAGLFIFTNLYPGIPMLFGRESFNKKLLYLKALSEQMDAVNIAQIKYFDFRIDGQIIVKENG
ncbi:cell division protein FtsQ [candidate division KSB1 bacterium]|nr:cell division protein FtsQ [candidate division KSB1 bacterium]